MNDLISRSALIEKLEKSIKWCEDNLANSTASFQSGCIAAIKDIIGSVKMEETCPSIDAEPVKHGHWIECSWPTADGFGHIHGITCSRCGAIRYVLRSNYCEFCGAKMDEVEANKTV